MWKNDRRERIGQMMLKEEQRNEARTMQADDSMLTPDALCSLYTHVSLPLLFPSKLVLPGDPHYYVLCQFPLTSLNSTGLPTELCIQMKLRIESEITVSFIGIAFLFEELHQIFW